jgi:ATP-dependent DNA ligase
MVDQAGAGLFRRDSHPQRRIVQVACLDGMPDFNALHSGKHNEEVQFCAFDVLALDSEDLRNLPLSMRKANLERLLRGRPDGFFVNPFDKARSRQIYFAQLATWVSRVGVKAQRSTIP